MSHIGRPSVDFETTSLEQVGRRKVRPFATAARNGLTGNATCSAGSRRRQKSKFAHCRSNNSNVKSRPALSKTYRF